MVANSIETQPKCAKKYGFWDNTKDGIKSTVTGGVAATVMFQPACILTMKKMRNYSNKFLSDASIFRDAAEEAINIAKLRDKGVNIEYIVDTPPKNIFMKIAAYLNQGVGAQSGYNAVTIVKDLPSLGLKKGTIYMPINSLPTLSFHEIGHQVNHNYSKICNLIQKRRGTLLNVIPSLLMLYGAFTKKSVPKDGEELTPLQKINNFIRDNAGKLSFLSMLPVVFEEGMASIQGQKLAKQLLSKKLFTAVKRSNLIGFGTYALTALSLAVMSGLTVACKDKFVENRQKANAQAA